MPPRRHHPEDHPAAKRAPAGTVLPFVIFDNEQFSINPDAVTFLESLGSQPLGVAALAGPYRHGKSFLLNRVLLQYEPGVGFPVGHTVNACTKGLHISTQLLTDSRTPGAAPVLIMDTEGLGAVSATDTHDMRIFSLALLLSSMFLYNSKGTIDQPAINNLALVTNISEHIRVSKHAENTDLSDFFPAFLWIVRDFALDLVDESGAALQADDYLENALRPVDQASPEKNRVRERLRTLFRHRGCVTMVRPCDDEQALKTLNQLPNTALKPSFLEQAALLRQLVLQRTLPAKVQGMHMTGPLLVRLARLYVDAINQGAAPVIKDSWSLISANECQRALAQAEQLFVQTLHEARVDGSALDRHHERKAVPGATLEEAFTRGFEKALALYKTRAMGDSTEEYRERLRDVLRARANKLRTENTEILTRKVDAAVAGFDHAFLEHATFEQVRAAFASVESGYYRDVGVDPVSRAAWHECVAKHVWDWATRFHHKQTVELTQLQGQLPLFEQQIRSFGETVQTVQDRATAAETALRTAEEANVELTAKASALQKELAQVLEEYDSLTVADRAAQNAQHEALAHTQAETARLEQQNHLLENSLVGARDALAEAERYMATTREELLVLQNAQNQAADWERKYRGAEDERVLLQRQLKELKGHFDKAAGDHERELHQLASSSAEAIGHLSAAKDHATDAARAAEKAQQSTQAAAEQLRRDLAHQNALNQRLEQEVATLRKAQQDERAEHKTELADVRGEASRNVKQFQRQLEEQAAQNREESRKRATRTREEMDKLFQEKVTAAGRAQQMEARAAQMEDALRETQQSLHQERERARELNLAGKVAMLEAAAMTAQTRFDMLQSTLVEKNDLVAEQQSQITDLEAELRQIQQRHEAEKLRLQLEFARKLGNS